MSERRVKVPRAVAAELRERYQARAEAERRLVDFLAGVVLTKGLTVADVRGFDDTTNELIVAAAGPPG